MKKVGIVVDNYKVDKFKKELTAKGFTNFKLEPFINDTTTIQVMVEEKDINEIAKICKLIELHFKHSN